MSAALAWAIEVWTKSAWDRADNLRCLYAADCGEYDKEREGEGEGGGKNVEGLKEKRVSFWGAADWTMDEIWEDNAVSILARKQFSK